jgi:excisionase family DNA binding protein
VPLDLIPSAIGELEKVKTTLWARLVTPAAPATGLPPVASEAAPITQEEAAERYRIPLRTIRRMTRTHMITSYLQGRNRMIRPGDLEDYIARCRAQAVKVGTRLDAY